MIIVKLCPEAVFYHDLIHHASAPSRDRTAAMAVTANNEKSKTGRDQKHDTPNCRCLV